MDRAPDRVFTGGDVRELRRPLVYVLRMPDGTPAYVGVGTNGVARPLSHVHHVITDKVPDDYRLEFYYCASAAEAVALELRLIAEWRPCCNKQVPRTTEQRDDELRRFLQARERAAERPKDTNKPVGIRRTGYGWQVFVTVGGRFFSKHFRPDTPVDIMREWRKVKRRTMKARYRRVKAARAFTAASTRPAVAASV